MQGALRRELAGAARVQLYVRELQGGALAVAFLNRANTSASRVVASWKDFL